MQNFMDQYFSLKRAQIVKKWGQKEDLYKIIWYRAKLDSYIDFHWEMLKMTNFSLKNL